MNNDCAGCKFVNVKYNSICDTCCRNYSDNFAKRDFTVGDEVRVQGKSCKHVVIIAHKNSDFVYILNSSGGLFCIDKSYLIPTGKYYNTMSLIMDELGKE